MPTLRHQSILSGRYTLKQAVHSVAPDFLKSGLHKIYDRWSLLKLGKLTFDTKLLRSRNDVSLERIFCDPEITANWNEDIDAIHANVPDDGRGGVNYGDGRAIYFLVNALAARDVLEVGTHIGVSTAHISSALRRVASIAIRPPNLTTVDIVDVNDPEKGPWVENGSECSPQEIVENLGNGDLVDFVTQDSTEFLKRCGLTFDLIFLDGSHAAEMVYRETSLALKLLNEGGVILLHDYFPDLKPLWSNNSVLPGPFLAGGKIQSECGSLVIQPLGALPWRTKLDSNFTSLAIVLKR